MENFTMFLKVKYDAKVQFLQICDDIKSEEFAPETILFGVLDKLKINTECEISLHDRDGAEICVDQLLGVILQFMHCNCFFIEIRTNNNDTLTNVKESSSHLINQKELETYLKSGDISNILKEYESNKTLTDNSRRSLVRESVNFLRKNCGNLPKREEKIALAKSIIQLFPSYKVANSKFEGIDLFYNPEYNTGYLAAKLKNLKHKLTKFSDVSNKKQKLSSVREEDKEEELSQDDLTFFQNCIVADNLQVVKEKLRETVKARIQFCATESNVLQRFPIFLYDSSLIAFDFALRYGEVASKSFLDNWSKYETFVTEISSEAIGGSSWDRFSDWSTEVLPFLNLLKLLPSTGLGRARKKVKLQESVDSFISFQNLNTPVAEYKVESHQPVILAVGQSKSSLIQYFINIDGKKINVPDNYNFCQLFDLYFKSFYVFNIEFDAAIVNFMQFFAKFLYGIDNQKKLTSRLIEIHSKFENKFKERLD